MEIQHLKKKFIEIYGGTDNDLRVFASPRRVNLIGEHTDYNGGFVFPAALTMQTTIVLRTRNDREINLAATDLEYKVNADLNSRTVPIFNHLRKFKNCPHKNSPYTMYPASQQYSLA